MLSCRLCCAASDGEELEMVNPEVVPAGRVLLGTPDLVKQKPASAPSAEDGDKEMPTILPGLETENAVGVVAAELPEDTDQVAGDDAGVASVPETLKASTQGSERGGNIASSQKEGEGSDLVSDRLSATTSWSRSTEAVGLRLRFRVCEPVHVVSGSRTLLQVETLEVVVRNKPLGVNFTKSMPARVARVAPGAGQLAGIQEGWVLTHIEDEEVSEDFDAFHSALLRALEALPLNSLTLIFRLPSGSETAIQLMHAPLGFVFGKRLPAIVREVNSRSMGFLVGAQLVSFGDRVVADYSDFGGFLKDLRQASGKLPKRRSVSGTGSASANGSRTSGTSSAS
jgi:hypothetical protein